MKWSIAVLVTLLTLQSVPIGNAQATTPLLVDDAGDVMLSIYDTSNPMPGGWDAVDLLSLNMIEDVDVIHFSLGVAGFPDCQSGTCTNAGDTRTHFDYGAKRYAVQTGTDGLGQPYGILHEVPADDDFQFLSNIILKVTADPNTFTYNIPIPREYLVDENGAPPRKDTALTNIYVRAYSQTSFGGPDPDNLQKGSTTDMLTTSDRMGLEAPATLPITIGGVANSGAVAVTSDAPYRASNGGEATIRYDLTASQTDSKEALFDLEFIGLPPTWTVERPEGVLRLPSGQPATFSILIHTPFGHQHGGSQAFEFKIVGRDNPNLWASVELGVHYVSVPQPSGHHPAMWFHSTAYPEPGRTFTTLNGGTNGWLFMNTLDEDPGDQGAPVQGATGGAMFDDFQWSICMTPDLRMGIDLNMTGLGEVEIPLQSTRSYSGVEVSARLLHLGPGEPLRTCFANSYNDRVQTVIATTAPSAPTTVGSTPTTFTLSVEPTTDGDYVPFEAGSMLVLEVFAQTAAPTPAGGGVSGPESMNLVAGGKITLPLDEYKDARPQGLVGWSDGNAGADSTEGPPEEFVPDVEVKGSPVAPLALIVVALGTLVAQRRR